MDKTQLQSLIERKLKEINLYSPEAVMLLMGTAAQESHLGKYIRQINGPALGVFQMEPATFDDIVINYLAYKPDLEFDIMHAAGIQSWENEQLEFNLALAICMARVHYLRIPKPLPHTIEDAAIYWKAFYNTHLGKGTVDEFLKNYKRFV